LVFGLDALLSVVFGHNRLAYLANITPYVQTRLDGQRLPVRVAACYSSAVRLKAATPLLLLLAGLPRAARADFKEWSVTLTPAYAIVYVDERAGSGGGGGVDVGFGVSESLTLHASGFLSWHDLDATRTARAGTASAFAAMVGLTYSLDVIRLVPSFELALGAIGVRGDAAFGSGRAAEAVVASSTAFAVGLGFGIDYLVTRHVAVGAAVRYHALVTDLTRIPVYLYVGPRVTFRFGG
jgi:hypothetical protein